MPTADHQVLPGGTAFLTDLGMCGDYDSVIGMEKEEPLRRFLTALPSGRFEPASGEATVTGVVVDLEPNGLARAIWPLRVGGRLSQVMPPPKPEAGGAEA